MRSVSSRHFLGGFLGGFLAIVLFGWLRNFVPAIVAPFLVPVGAVIGFTMGFAYELLWRRLTSAAQEGLKYLENIGYAIAVILILLIALVSLPFHLTKSGWQAI